MKSQVLHTVWRSISGEAAGEIWNWSLSGLKGLSCKVQALDPLSRWKRRVQQEERNVRSPSETEHLAKRLRTWQDSSWWRRRRRGGCRSNERNKQSKKKWQSSAVQWKTKKEWRRSMLNGKNQVGLRHTNIGNQNWEKIDSRLPSG